MALNAAFDNALSIAIPYYTKKFTDAITTNSPFLAALKKKGGFLYTGGGKSVIMPLRLASGEPVIVTDPLAVVTTTRDNSITAASYDWVQLYSPLNIPFSELNQLGNNAAGLEQYVKAKISGVIADTGVLINAALLSANAVAPTSTTIGNLEQAIAGSDVGYGMPPNASTNWASHVVINSGLITQHKVLKAMVTISALNGSIPNMIVTTPELWAALADLAQVAQHVTTTGHNIEDFGMGFANFYFYNAMVVADALVPEGTMYLINTENMKLCLNKEIQVTEVAAKEPVRFWRFTQFVQLAIDSRRPHGVIKGLLAEAPASG